MAGFYSNANSDMLMMAPLIGNMGIVAAIALPTFGAAYGTAKSGQGIAAIAPRRPNMIMKSIVHAVMAGVIAIYGLVVAVLLAQKIDRAPKYDLASAYNHLAGGMAVGICGMAGGMCIGVLGNWGTRSSALRPQMFMSAVLMTGFAMVLGMYGLIVALLQAAK